MTRTDFHPPADWDDAIAWVEMTGQEGRDWEIANSAPRIPPLPAVDWGIGWEVKGGKRPHWSGELTSAATHGHLGASGTMVWADPATDVACALFTNRALVSGWTRERPRQAMFSNAVTAAVL